MTSLEKLSTEEEYILRTIRFPYQTPQGRESIYMIVEGEYDKKIYHKFVDHNFVYIFSSAMNESQGGGGYLVLEKIVKKLSTKIANVMGIRDADYVKFDNNYTTPQNIFLTDSRDIEMMMFQCGNVSAGLNRVSRQFNSCYSNVIPIARKVGYFRIYNSMQSTGWFNFEQNLSISRLLDTRTGGMDNGEYDSFLQNFCSHFSLSIEQYNQCKAQWKQFGDDQVCRGHDVVSLLAHAVRNNEFSKEKIKLNLAVYYSKAHFQTTQLYKDVSAWGKARNKRVFDI